MITDYQQKGRANNCCARKREATNKSKIETEIVLLGTEV